MSDDSIKEQKKLNLLLNLYIYIYIYIYISHVINIANISNNLWYNNNYNFLL